jgi:ketosteroid isomerase-like protein
MDATDVERWVQGYVKAWLTSDPDDIRGLFTEDAKYYTRPYRAPWNGRDAIVEEWGKARDEPGTWHFRSEVMAVSGDLAFVRGWTSYPDKRYSNLWVIRMEDSGACSEFTEWWMLER